MSDRAAGTRGAAAASEPARVLAIAQATELGGAEYSLLRNAQLLPGHGFHVEITVPGEGGLAAAAREAGVGVHHLSVGELTAGRWSGAALAVPRARRLARAIAPHLVWLNGTVAGRLAPALTSHTLVPQVHDFPPRAPRPWRSARFWRAAPVVMCDSQAVADAAEAMGAPADRLRVVYVPAGRPDPTPEPDWAGDGPIVGFVGRIEPRKAPLELLRAFERVLERVPEARLALVGADELAVSRDYARAVSSLAASLGDRVLLLGRVPDASGLMAWFDVFCMPSNEEALGVVAIEALAAGTPVVATDSGGPREFVVDGLNGALVPVGDEAALADALVATLAKAPAMREAARRSAEPFTAERVAERVAAALREALEVRS